MKKEIVLITVLVFIIFSAGCTASMPKCPNCGSNNVVNSEKVKDVNGSLVLSVPVSSHFPTGYITIPSTSKGSYYTITDRGVEVYENPSETGKPYDCKNCNTTFFA